MENLKLVALKGEGSFCIVKLYRNEITNEEFALKELMKKHYDNAEYRYRMEREVALLKELKSCRNIIELIEYGHEEKEQKMWYLMPYAKQNLYDFIKTRNSSLNKTIRYEIAYQVIQAIKYAHSKNILHRDLSPSNVLVFESSNDITIKVSDFGLGKNTESLSNYTRSSTSNYGQILYVSPEQRIQLNNATKRSDIFSLGKLIYFIFTGKDPDNLKNFELSSLVTKATEDDPEDRFKDIIEFEMYFLTLKEIELNLNVPDKYITLKDFISSDEKINWLKFHQLAISGNYNNHVYHDYINPVISVLATPERVKEYYKIVGNGIRAFATTFSERLYECLYYCTNLRAGGKKWQKA